MKGQSHHTLLEQGSVVSIQPASIAGQLIDMGEYPALHLSPWITSRVHGELIEVERLDTILDRLDEYEGPEFRREIVHVTLDNGHSHAAWTYVLASEFGEPKVIPSGRWNASAAGV
jgi:gamma-glutamylcyclotransferase (GGCT)/AIG2-like uncharacterized protein YtfP